MEDSPPRRTESLQSTPRALRTNNSQDSQASTLSEQPIKRRRVNNRSKFVLDEAEAEEDDEDENEDEHQVRNSLRTSYLIPFNTQLHVSSSQGDGADSFIDDSENHSQGDFPLPHIDGYRCLMVINEDEDGNEERCGAPCGNAQFCFHCLHHNGRGWAY